MKYRNIITVLVLGILILSSIATLTGILSDYGPGEYKVASIRGQEVRMYGKGIYRDMSSDVAIQGIAQDYVTLFAGAPLLLISLFLTRRGSIRSRFLLTGVLGYFMVTYIFYMCMAMYNSLFVVYILLASFSFYAFLLSILSFDFQNTYRFFGSNVPKRTLGGFLIFNSIIIALMWLGVVIPPLLDGSIYPAAVEHYTTLIVQGMDLSILLPASFISGLLILKNRPGGFILAPVYIIFLSLLMTALIAKIAGMSLTGVNAGPALVLIPLITITAISISFFTIRSVAAEK